MKCTVVIRTLNEAPRLRLTLASLARQTVAPEVIVVNDADCIDLMSRFIREKPQLWNEDIAED